MTWKEAVDAARARGWREYAAYHRGPCPIKHTSNQASCYLTMAADGSPAILCYSCSGRLDGDDLSKHLAALVRRPPDNRASGPRRG